MDLNPTTTISFDGHDEQLSAYPNSGSVHRLMEAVLDDALNVMRMPVGAVRRTDRRNTLDWFADDDTDYVFAFRRICDTLGLDPWMIRAQLAHDGSHRELRHSA